MGSLCTGVVVFHRFMVEWGRECICLTGICETMYVSVVVFHRSMLDWRRGSVCQSDHM